MRPCEIAVVGAGPAGLAAGIALKKSGFAVSVFEQSPQSEAAGSGLLLQSNGLRVLDALGVLPRLLPKLRPCTAMTLESGGRRIFTIPYAELPLFHPYCAAVFRRDLLQALLETACQNAVPLFAGRRCTGAQLPERGSGICLTFAGANGCETLPFDAVVACDGVHSPLRNALGLLRGKAPFSCPPWLRVTAPVHTAQSTVRELWGRDGRGFGVFPMGGNQTHFFCSAPPRAKWNALLQDPAALQNWINGWAHFGPEIARLVRAVPDWGAAHYGTPAFVQTNAWHKSGVFLVGDAAHAMPPNLGQGANSALTDALVLAHLLAREAERSTKASPDWESVGRAYQNLRGSFVRKTQRAARGLGFWAEKPGPVTRFLRDEIVLNSAHIPALRNAITQVTVGHNPPEDAFLGL